MLTEPRTVSAANYVLAPAGKFYAQRTGKVRAIVVHVTAGLQDLGMAGTDESAEGTNRWALNSRPEVSWHRIADSDGVERCLPSWATAWQAAGYNSNTVGEEISNLDARWDNKPANWVKWTIWHAALGVADWVVTYKVPIRRATKAELDHAIATKGAPVGFIDHSRLSTNRTDPGATFPWEMFFHYVRAIIAGATSPDNTTAAPTTSPEDIVTPQDKKDIIDGLLGAKVIPANMLVPNRKDSDPDNLVALPRAFELALRWSLEGRDAGLRAEAIAKAMAEKGSALTPEEVDQIATEVGERISAGFDVRLEPKGPTA